MPSWGLRRFFNPLPDLSYNSKSHLNLELFQAFYFFGGTQVFKTYQASYQYYSGNFHIQMIVPIAVFQTEFLDLLYSFALLPLPTLVLIVGTLGISSFFGRPTTSISFLLALFVQLKAFTGCKLDPSRSFNNRWPLQQLSKFFILMFYCLD